MKNEIKKLNNDKNDYISSILSGTLGALPFAGPFLSEIINYVIPNQRTDRIVDFVKDLAIELEKQRVDIESLKTKFDDNYRYGAYVTNCFRYLTMEVYEEKISYYKNLCVSGIVGDEKNLIHNERILKILSDLDFYEIQYLRYYYDPMLEPTEMMNDVFNKIEFDILMPQYDLGMEEEQRIEETYKQITLNNLEKNGLLETVININSNHKNYKITMLGKVVLKKIGYDEIIV